MNLYNIEVNFRGHRPLTVTGGNGHAGIKAPLCLFLENNVFVVAIGGKDAASGIEIRGNLTHNRGFFIHGLQGGGNFSEE